MMGWDSGWGWLGAIWMISFWVAVIALVVWAVSRLSGPRTTHGRAEEILEERFARGEIDREEFEERRRELANS
ncbi:MAG: SHOCT domain-containing protein [Actinomycetota bacterium]